MKKYKFSSETIEKDILSKYDLPFIEATLKHCELYFKQANVPNKEGFIIKALEKGYYQDEIESTTQRKQKKAQKETDKQSKDDLQKLFQSHLNKQVEEALN